MAEPEWDSSVSGYRQTVDASGSALHVKNQMTPWRPHEQTRESSSHSQAETTKDKISLSFQFQDTSKQPSGRRDDSKAVKTKGLVESSGSNRRVMSRTFGQMGPSEENGDKTQPLSRQSQLQSLYGGVESIQHTSKPDASMETASREGEIQRRKHVVGKPTSDVVESGEQSLAVGPLASLLKESSVSCVKTKTLTSGMWTPTSDQGTWTMAPSEGSIMSQHQRALWEQNQPAEAVVSKSQESTSLLGVARKSNTSHEDYSLSHPEVSAVEPLLCDEEYPDKVDGAALNDLRKGQLISQCFLRDKLLEGSEKHEKEMFDELNQQDEQLRVTAEENSRLREKVWRLKEENRQLRSREMVATGTEENVSKEKSDWGAVALLQMVTILYTCQVRDFAFVKMIAHGCEGAVFLGHCLHRGSELFKQQVFALKVMFNVFGHSTFTQVRNFYKNEYQALCAMVPHPNIVRLYAFFYDRLSNDVSDRFHELPPVAAENARTLSLFLVMEHIPTTLEQAATDRRKSGRLTVKQVMQWTLDILTGIEHLLKHCYLHRDLKLNNILVSDEGILKLCDFGCSIQLEDNMMLLYSPGSSLGGNPAHMPPELLNAIAGRKLQCGSQDLWACGVLVHEMVAGDSPFTSLDQRGYRMSDLPQLVIQDEKSGEVSVESRRFPERFIRLVLSLLEFEPSKRPRVHEAIEIIKELLG